MRLLPDRVYPPDTPLRRRLFGAAGMPHPAKARLGLMRDLVLRYTRPGDVILDPFGGVGSALIACTLPEPRDVVLVEIESKFCQAAAESWAHLRAWWTRQLIPGPLGRAWIVQADSRHLPLAPAGAAVVCSSPPYGGSDAVDNRATWNSTITRHRGGLAHRLPYSPHSANIALLPRGDVAAAITSPPYADVADRNRSQEGYSQHLDPVLRDEYGHAGGNRHIDGYGATAGQIGALPRGEVSAAMGSPPYGNTFSDWDLTSSGAALGTNVHWSYSDERGAGAKRNIGNIPYYDGERSAKRSPRGPEGAETYASAVLQVYAECARVVRPGGLLVLIVGNYVRDNALVDLATDTIALAVAAGWTPVERWRGVKTQLSFWRILHHRQRPQVPVVDDEHVLVFSKGAPAWALAALPPTTRRPVAVAAPAARRRSESDAPLLTKVETTGVPTK